MEVTLWEFEQESTPPAPPPTEAVPSRPPWITPLLASPLLAEQKKLGGRAVPADETLADLLTALDSAGGKLTIVDSFDNSDGYYPDAPLVQAANGNFYGTTLLGGGSGPCEFASCGTIFSLTSGGALTTLHSFDDTDGSEPSGGLVQATNGTFYGVTAFGGASGDGTIFSLALGLGPFVETLPASGKVGAAVMILGTDLTGATSVTSASQASRPSTFSSPTSPPPTTTQRRPLRRRQAM